METWDTLLDIAVHYKLVMYITIFYHDLNTNILLSTNFVSQ